METDLGLSSLSEVERNILYARPREGKWLS